MSQQRGSMLARFQYLLKEGFGVSEACDIVNAENGHPDIRIVPPASQYRPTPESRSERSTAPLTGLRCRILLRCCLIVAICAGMWVYGHVAEAGTGPDVNCQALGCPGSPPDPLVTTTTGPIQAPALDLPPFTG